MASSPLCIVSDRRGEWSQCEDGSLPLGPLTSPTGPLVRKRAETAPNAVFVGGGVVLAGDPDGWETL